jgi:hypothetical protein
MNAESTKNLDCGLDLTIAEYDVTQAPTLLWW